jgi:hypothetical protein
MLSGWRPTRRSVLQAIGLGGLGAAASVAGVVQTGVASAGVGAGVRALPVLPAPRARLEESFTTGWQSVQLHTHSNRVVAQLPWTSPHKVLEWYMEHGYKAVALTNLLHFTPVAGLASELNDPGWFLVIQGEEPSFEPDGPGVRIVDTLGVGTTGPVDNGRANRGTTTAEIWTNQSDAIRAVGGLPILAHPNLTWAGTGKDLAEADPKHNPIFVELVNTEPGINWRGGGGRPGVEAMWDEAMTRSKRRILAVCADDSHHFDGDVMSKSRRPDEPTSPPGRAWQMVHADELTWPAIRRGLEDPTSSYGTMGQIGIRFVDLEVSRTGIKITLSDTTDDLGWSTDGHNPRLFTTFFIGEGGKVLHTTGSLKPEYKLKPGDGRYVRARVEASDCFDIAWTQPAFR